MLDIGWTELLVIGALALIVVGPRDLPHLLRSVGQTVGKVKRMAREFQRSIEDAARDTDVSAYKEMRDLKKDIGGFDFRQQASKAQSYLNQPVKTEAGKAKAAAATTAVAGAAAEAKTGADAGGETPPAPVEPAERRPAAAEAPSPSAAAKTPEPRQAGAKG